MGSRFLQAIKKQYGSGIKPLERDDIIKYAPSNKTFDVYLIDNFYDGTFPFRRVYDGRNFIKNVPFTRGSRVIYKNNETQGIASISDFFDPSNDEWDAFHQELASMEHDAQGNLSFGIGLPRNVANAILDYFMSYPDTGYDGALRRVVSDKGNIIAKTDNYSHEFSSRFYHLFGLIKGHFGDDATPEFEANVRLLFNRDIQRFRIQGIKLDEQTLESYMNFFRELEKVFVPELNE